MAYNEHTELETSAEEEESILVSGVVRVVEFDGTLIKEDRLSFLERNPMFALVGPALGFMPLKANHNDIIMLI